jgi:hypothetical protein
MEHLLLKITRHYSFSAVFALQIIGRESFKAGSGGPLHALKAYSE